MKNICVYLGANTGFNKSYAEIILVLGKEIAEHEFTLIYGGSSLGLMGLLANTVKEHGGTAIGIITDDLIKKEIPLTNLDQLIVVETMQERKLLMQKMADAFVVMPGGLGTLEEALETWNAIKIGLIKKPIGFMNVENYFEGLFAFMNKCKDSGFVSEQHLKIPVLEHSPQRLLQILTTKLDVNPCEENSNSIVLK